MKSYLNQMGQLASRRLVDPMSFTPSMADIAPRFQQFDSTQSQNPEALSFTPRFQMPDWLRTLTDFFSPAPQAAIAGLPLVMQMSGKGASSASKPRGSDPKVWRRYYMRLSNAELQGILHDKRDEMIAFIRREAAQLNRTFADVIPPEVRSIDPLDIDYWERIEQCLFKPVGARIIDKEYPEIKLEEFIYGLRLKSEELGQLVQIISERTPLIEVLGLIDLVTMRDAATMLTCDDGTYRVTHEQLEQARAEQPDACALRRTDSGSLLDPLPDEDAEYCLDPLGDD